MVKYEEYSKAKTSEEKLKRLEEFYSLMPKHKGTQKLEKFVRRRIAELRREVGRKRAQAAKKGGVGPFLKKKGAAQVVVLGLTNSGRSTILSSLTKARAKVSPTPYTTILRPIEGTMSMRGTRIQLVEAPPILRGGAGRPTKMALALARNSDALAIAVDGTDEPVEALSELLSTLERNGISLGPSSGSVSIKRDKGVSSVVISIRGRIIDGNEADVRRLLESYDIKKAVVEAEGRVRMEDFAAAILAGRELKPAIIFVTRSDLPEGLRGHKKVSRAFKGLEVVAFSPDNPPNKEELGGKLLKVLGLIRVFTKSIHEKEPDEKAMVMRRSTVIEAARSVHKSFTKTFRYAKLWSERLPYSPMKVGRDFQLEDGDVIEIHA